MKKIGVFLLYVFCALSISLNANADEDLLRLFQVAVQKKDGKLIEEVVHAFGNDKLIESLAKYNNCGNLAYAVHNAIKNKDLVASIILAYYSKTANYAAPSCFICDKCSGNYKNALELALEVDLIDIIPFLLHMKKIDPYYMRNAYYVCQLEENTEYLNNGEFSSSFCKIADGDKWFFVYGGNGLPNGNYFQRNFICDAIAKNRLDILEILQQLNTDWNKVCFKAGRQFTPLQFALLLNHYEIAQFLINHGARIE